MLIEYKVNQEITLEAFKELLSHSTLGPRRPLNDDICLQGMLDHTNLMVTAWAKGQLVGVARSMTDFHFACYLSDLAVHEGFQRHGIGKQLQAKTQAQLGPKCKLILIAAPAAADYYQPLGYEHHPRCWILEPDVRIKGTDSTPA